MDAAIQLDDLNSLIDDLETQINEVQLPQPQAATVTLLSGDTQIC